MHLFSPWLLWAQTSMPGVPSGLVNAYKWLFIWGEPDVTENSIPLVGGLITWTKTVGIFALLGWLLSWVTTAIRSRRKARWGILDIAALVALVGLVASVTLNVLESTKRLNPMTVGGGYSVPTALALACGVLILLWVEVSLGSAIRRVGKFSDGLVLLGLHLAMALGVWVVYLRLAAVSSPDGKVPGVVKNYMLLFMLGVRLGTTYMGLVVLMKVVWLLIPECLAMRPRRLFAIAKHSVVEANRRMWAPWVVIVLFGVFLAFTHWFIPASQQRPAELGRYYVGTLTLLSMLLLTVMVTVLAPLSLPQDIQMQTVYTIVSKPVRRIEMVIGRLIGYMTIVTALLLLFGGVSLWYLSREVGGTITALEKESDEVRPTDPDKAKYLTEQADQLRTRMSARNPVKGSLTFIDSRGTRQVRGIDVGQELEFRSHIEGATEAAAIWDYGPALTDPFDPQQRINRIIPVNQLLVRDTIEAIEDEAMTYEYAVRGMAARTKAPNVSAAEVGQIAVRTTQANTEIQKLRARSQEMATEYNKLVTKANELDAAKKLDEADAERAKAAALHSPAIPLEMTFTIYRTTKGTVGEPVFAEIQVENPLTNVPKFRDTFPIREYYTNKRVIPSSYLVGSQGAMRISIRCKSATQYLGMAESDLYLLSNSGDFGLNFMKGLVGVWLQAMVITAIGVFAGTFLSWPVALLFTIAFAVAGHAAFSILRGFFEQTYIGGGPFESLLRLIGHENQVGDLAPTVGVIVAKTFDSIVVPVMTKMVYLIPNLSTLDVSNKVAEGFAVLNESVLENGIVALAYVVPFSIAGYFILKNREVAA